MDVSRETKQRLDVLCAMVAKWNRSINLVSPDSVAHIMNRHVRDSAQLVDFCPEATQSWADLGSGGGFPGLVVAAILKERLPDCQMTLIEADQRKCVFLREAAREMDLHVTVLAQRIEDIAPQNADVVSARALAPLPRLLVMVHQHLKPSGTGILLKGQSLAAELHDAARAGWKFQSSQHTSASDPSGIVLVVRNLKRESTQ